MCSARGQWTKSRWKALRMKWMRMMGRPLYALSVHAISLLPNYDMDIRGLSQKQHLGS